MRRLCRHLIDRLYHRNRPGKGIWCPVFLQHDQFGVRQGFVQAIAFSAAGTIRSESPGDDSTPASANVNLLLTESAGDESNEFDSRRFHAMSSA